MIDMSPRVLRKRIEKVSNEEKKMIKKRSKKDEEENEDTVENISDEEEMKGKKRKVIQKKKKEKIDIYQENDEEKMLRERIGIKVLESSKGSTKRLGMHASANGSVVRSIHYSRSIGCLSYALFVRNQRQWNSKPMDEIVVENWNRIIQETQFPLDMILPHGSYLMNPGSPDTEKLQKTRDAMLDECMRCERLGITLYNFHPGSSTGIGTRDECIHTVAETIDYIIERTNKIILVIETMAGQGHTVGGTFQEIRSILDAVKGDSSRVGVCIDTCHIFAAGYDIRTKEKYDKTMQEFEDIIGFDKLKGVHLNDSKSELGSNLDRHERIGKGMIGLNAFKYIMNDQRFNDLPMILETPEGDYANEMILLYGLEDK